MDNIKEGLKIAALIITCMIGIIASAGALNYGYTNSEGVYSVCGAINFGNTGWAVYSLYKLLFKKKAE